MLILLVECGMHTYIYIYIIFVALEYENLTRALYMITLVLETHNFHQPRFA